VISVDDALRLAGIVLDEDRRRAELGGECARLARVLREASVHRVGLAPAADDVAVPAVAVALGRSLAEASASPVGIIDAMGTWGCARALLAEPDQAGLPLVTLWLLRGLALLTPREAGDLRSLEEVLREVGQGPVDFEYLLVDLTGLEQRGERRAAIELLDAAVLVARSGRTTASQARLALRDIPEGRDLGVLLTGL